MQWYVDNACLHASQPPGPSLPYGALTPASLLDVHAPAANVVLLYVAAPNGGAPPAAGQLIFDAAEVADMQRKVKAIRQSLEAPKAEQVGF